ncbi:MAG: S9 family peptidase [Chloroflexi bacterium]|nr:S9 family peptidase [Chloroflexota bacterium]
MLTQNPYTFNQFASIRRYFTNAGATLTFSPDGKEIAYITNTSGQFNLWKQPSAGGYPIQLTMFNNRIARTGAWSPDGEHILLSVDYQGDEYHQLYLIPARGGEPQPITREPKVQHIIDSHPWSPDGRYIAYAANDRSPAHMDVLVRDMRTGEVARVLFGDGLFYPESWSPDGRYIVAVEWITATDYNLYLIDLRRKATRLLTPHSGDAAYAAGPWMPDSSGFYFISDEGRDFKGLAFYDLNKDAWRWAITPEWEVSHVEGTHDGSYLLWDVNEDGLSKLHLRDQRNGRLLKLPGLPRGATVSMPVFSPNRRKLAFFISSGTSPAELYVLDMRTRKLNRITHSMLGGVNAKDMVEPRLIRYRSSDGLRIAAWLYKPKRLKKGQRVPVVVSVHGGPEAQESPYYGYGLYQYWLSRGIAVLAPNIRGSTGYGKAFQRLIYNDWGGGELRDIEHAVKYLCRCTWVDPERIGLFGPSFGGFVVLSAISRLPEYWAAAVDWFGPSNLVSSILTDPPWWRKMDEMTIGDPEKDFDELMARSPVTYAEKIRAPLFVVQGALDMRVVKSESDQIVERLRALGVPVRYDVFTDEGHGFTKRANELQAVQDTAEFLEQHLLKR